MKILIFSVAYEPFVGGAEIAVKEITDRLPNIEFHLVTVNLDGRQKREEKIGNVFVYRTGHGFFGRGFLGKLLFPFSGVWMGLRIHRRHNFDATWSIMANYAGFAALFFKYRQPKVPFILTLQEGDPIDYIKRQVWFIYPLFVEIFRRADRIQAISNYLADFARSMLPSASAHAAGARAGINVIPNGVNVSLFSRQFAPAELDELRAKFGKTGDGSVGGGAVGRGEIFLVTASRLVVKNGVADVIRALPILPENIKFLIIGTGPLESSLKKLARDLGVGNRVIFTGFVAHSDLPKFLKISDIFIRPSLSEGLGISFIEAMAAGLPIIATPVGGIPDFLRDGVTGLFCAVRNPKSIADKVKQILNDNELRVGLISRAQKLVAERYDWNTVARDMEEKVFKWSKNIHN